MATQDDPGTDSSVHSFHDITVPDRTESETQTQAVKQPVQTITSRLASVSQTIRNRWHESRLIAFRLSRKKRQDPLTNWQNWSPFRLWRHTRPLWGSVWMIIAALILLFFPLSLLQYAFLLNSIWASILVGGLLLVMGLIQLFLPSYSVMTGSIGIVLSLVSFLTNSFGGLALGMLLGIIGCALSIAWRPVPRSRLIATSSSTPQ